MANDFTALGPIQAPGTAVFGYQRGDAVSADVVDGWELLVGDPSDPDAQVCEGDLPEGEIAVRLAPPAPEATHGEWQSWAVAAGMPEDKAAEASLDDLQAYRPEGTEESAAEPGRPAESAKKAEWVAYAKERGADAEWAEAKTTTVADLQAWQPGDTVALAATEAQAD